MSDIESRKLIKLNQRFDLSEDPRSNLKSIGRTLNLQKGSTYGFLKTPRLNLKSLKRFNLGVFGILYFLVSIFFTIPWHGLDGATIKTVLPTDSLKQGLVGHWTFDGKDMIGGTVRDISGRGNHGSMVGMATSTAIVQGKIGQALKFNGASNGVNISSLADDIQTGDVSVSFWMKPGTLNFGVNPAVNLIFALADAPSNNDVKIGLMATGQVIFLVWNESGGNYSQSGTLSWSKNTWYHIVATFSASNGMILYRDGVVVATRAQFTRTTTYATEAYIGKEFDGFFANVSVDDVRVYNREVSVPEIKKLYEMGGASMGVTPTASKTSNLKSGLVGHWTFDGKDMRGGTVWDMSGNNKNGNMQNMSSSSAFVQGRIGQGLNFKSSANTQVKLPNDSYDSQTRGTISAWVKLSSKTNNGQAGGIIGAQTSTPDQYFTFGSYGLSSTDTRLVIGSMVPGVNFVYSNTSLELNRWYHVAVTSNGSRWSIYLDGSSQSLSTLAGSNTGAWFSSIASGISPYFIGQRGSDSNYFNGIIDDVRIYDQELPASEIKKLYEMGGASMGVTPTPISNLKTGLVGHWTFDGKDMRGGTVWDVSGQGNHGNINIGTATSTRYVTGVLGQGLQIKGNPGQTDGQFVKLPNDVYDSQTQGTISGWVKLNNGPLDRGIVSNESSIGDYFYFGTYGPSPGDRRLLVGEQDGTPNYVYGNTRLRIGEWYHVVATSNGSTWSLYVNGVAESLTILSGSNTGSWFSLRSAGVTRYFIGDGGEDSNQLYLNGAVDDVRIYNRALSPAEIQQLYNMGK